MRGARSSRDTKLYSCAQKMPSDAGCETPSTHMVVAGALIALVGGVGVGVSMTWQRYALLHAPAHVRFCGRARPAMRVWGLGMILYQLSNAMFAVSTMFAPLSLCTACFTLLLAWNIVGARQLLGETLTRARAIGVTLIVAGCITSAVGVPPDACNAFTIPDVARLTRSVEGTTYLSVLSALALVTSISSVAFERRYPIGRPPRRPLARLMTLVEPMSLGIQEGMTQLAAKALFSMIFNDMIHAEFWSKAASEWVWLFLSVLSVVGVATIFWIRFVYARYPTTIALPIEYGTVHTAQILGGCIFFQEYRHMDAPHVALATTGLAMVLAGVGCAATDDVATPKSDGPTLDRAPTVEATSAADESPDNVL